ncbi:hypothetical protein NL50_12490 [Clostridium acetobutylicum]|nr:hypothetical protein NL50_12490 [Clostridium acetobutylicum]
MLIMGFLKNKKVVISLIIIICLLFLSIISYLIFKYVKAANNNHTNLTNIKNISQDIEGIMYTDNTSGNTYNVKFYYLDGKDIRNIKPKSSKCSIRILSKVKTGNLNLKLKKNNNIILDKTISNKSVNANTTLNVTGVDSNGINIEVTAKKAHNGIVYIEFN